MTRRSSILFAPALASTLLLTVAPSAHAESASPAVDIEFSTVTLDEALQQNTITSSSASEAINSYVDEQEAEGREIDPENVTAVEFNEPNTGDKVTAVWDDGVIPTRFDTAHAQYPEGDEQKGYGVGIEADPETTAGDSPSTNSAFGVETEGMEEEGSACVQVEFQAGYASNPDGTRENHALVSCYEKHRAVEIETPDARDWSYFRYGQFTSAEPRFPEISPEPRIIDFSLRTQPWDGNSDDNVREMTGFAPMSPEEDCEQGGEFQLALGSASMTFPVTRCNDIWVDVKPNEGAYGSIFQGSETVQVANSYGMALESTAAGREVVMSDYAWSEVHWGAGGPTEEESYLWEDGGWTPWNDL